MWCKEKSEDLNRRKGERGEGGGEGDGVAADLTRTADAGNARIGAVKGDGGGEDAVFARVAEQNDTVTVPLLCKGVEPRGNGQDNGEGPSCQPFDAASEIPDMEIGAEDA